MSMQTTPHWPQVGVGRAGVGSAVLPGDRTEIAAANGVLAYFDNNPCTRASIPVVADFQRAYNASGLPGSLSVDGQYGPNTQRALQNVIDEAEAGLGPTQGAPPNCFAATEAPVPAPDVTPVAPATPATPANPTTVVVNPSSTSPNYVPYVVGGVVAAAAVAGGVILAKRRKRRHG